jgi:hypothetical protein
MGLGSWPGGPPRTDGASAPSGAGSVDTATTYPSETSRTKNLSIEYENFMTGFWAAGERRAEVWGRPAALAIAKDGSLLVADDTGGTIWKVSYTGEAQAGTADGHDKK